MRILASGPRSYCDHDHVFTTLDRLNAERAITVVINGAGPGAETLARRWALSRNVVTNSYPPSWSDTSHPDALVKHNASGRAYDARAAFRRNRIMIERGKPD